MIIFTQLGELGRLGNQFFQVAATISHAHRMGEKAAFNKWSYNKWMLNPIVDNLDYMAPWADNKEHDVVPHTQFDYKPIPAGKNQMLTGFFQSEKYFVPEKVVETFKPRKELMELVRLAGKNIIHHNNVCAIHVRRTDYLEKQDYHPVMPKEYYEVAVKRVQEKYPDVVFLLFSDNMTEAREMIHPIAGPNYYISEHNTDIVDLYLMAHCHHHIIANSSFSWWAAWLRRMFWVKPQTVIAPSIWAGPRWRDEQPQNNFQDIYCENWIKI